ncbi:ribonuclease HI family protein [Candidatus Peregrinibacteria bacterium]|nr:ribonuclease HI family protein [Candidatus Peregrinibacteria bacterium]
MIRLPASLERKLAEQFPLIRERERFVAETVGNALEGTLPSEKEQPLAIGGTIHLFTDGGSRGNPGQAAIACIIEDPLRGTVLKEYAEVIGIATNNVAEYRALIKGLALAHEFHPNRLICHLDSELIVKQLNGEYRIRMPSLQVFVEEIRAITETLPDVVFTFVPREDNYRADALVNKALDAHPSPSYKKPQRRTR